MSFYKSISPFYDYIFPPAPLQVNFINRVAGNIAGKRILEAGCGTGNLALQLVEQGAMVEGIDLDPEMIAFAQEKAVRKENVRFSVLDVLKINEKWEASIFDAVVSFGNTLVHLNDLEQVSQLFLNVWAVLKPGSSVIVQIINYDRIFDKQIQGLPTIENDEIKFERFYDFNDSAASIDFRTILKVKQSGEEICNVVKLLPLRRQQLETLLKNCGFENVLFYGNFKGETLSMDSVPLIVSAQK
ncbi:bifunctional 2-polyprenyl-6-hydroxyphenol methylase/3-demethylubiquinol 3-O-methyltransferase UbiG [Marinilabilia sp.]|uniref:class I SAM-dependent methyltransferase n=1 Tax=Marinilabilia sp. TaxID=2021252 RepID=UPI0025C285D1|nr:class I SAM-dependent methyltransferase [Marinilabilia sp.]